MYRLTLALAVLAAAPLAAQDFSWHKAMGSGKTLEVRGVNGRIRATRASGTEAKVTATKRAHRGDPDDVKIEVMEDNSGVTICAVYPRRGRGSNSCTSRESDHDDRNDTEVNFEVEVPAGVEFVGSTVNGDAIGRDLPADAQLSTVNGDVDVEAGGIARASTVNGSVTARLGEVNWDRTLRFSSVNGGIEVIFPKDIDADIEASTVNGSIESDFPITVKGRVNPRSLRGTIGKGGKTLELNTVNGSIRLRQR